MNRLNLQRIQCPVGLSTLHFGRQRSGDRQPYCYLGCGHVHGLVDWGDQGEHGKKQCPLCRQVSKCVPLVVGKESAFQLDSESPLTVANKNKFFRKIYDFQNTKINFYTGGESF